MIMLKKFKVENIWFVYKSVVIRYFWKRVNFCKKNNVLYSDLFDIVFTFDCILVVQLKPNFIEYPAIHTNYS